VTREIFTPRLYAGAGALLAACAIAAVVAGSYWGRAPEVTDPIPGERQAADAPRGGEPESYAATVTRRIEVAGEARVETSRVARNGDLTRADWSENGRRFVSIVRPDLGLAWLVDLDGATYVERPLGQAAAYGEGPLDGEQVEALVGALPVASVARERAGTERVAGYDCTIYRSRIGAAEGGSAEATVWEADEIGGLALKTELRDASGATVTTELSDLDLAPDPSLFELPAGARSTP
jgi:hypothetical protein